MMILIHLLLTTATLNFATDSAFAAPRMAVTDTYSATCRYPYPLSSYDGCNAYSRAGQDAAGCAADQALLDCRDAYSSDCIVEGTQYRDIISEEFIGFKACQATVRVHGYRLMH